VAEFKKLAGVSDVEVEDHLLRMRVFGPITPVLQAAARLGVTDFLSREPSLEETFLAQYGRETGEAAGAAGAK
jgi:ABC-2 type transport system ATP-binding protein